MPLFSHGTYMTPSSSSGVALKLLLSAPAGGVRGPAPGDLQPADGFLVDLVEWGVAVLAAVAAPAFPLARVVGAIDRCGDGCLLRPRLTTPPGVVQRERQGGGDGQNRPSRPQSCGNSCLLSPL